MKMLSEEEKIQNVHDILIPALKSWELPDHARQMYVDIGDEISVSVTQNAFAKDFGDLENDEIRNMMQALHNDLCKKLGIKPAEIVFYVEENPEDDFVYGEYKRNNRIKYNENHLTFLRDTAQKVGANVYAEIVGLTIDKAQDDCVKGYCTHGHSTAYIDALYNYKLMQHCNKKVEDKNKFHCSSMTKLADLDRTYNLVQLLDKIENAELKEQLKPIILKQLKMINKMNSVDMTKSIINDYRNEAVKFDKFFKGEITNNIGSNILNINVKEFGTNVNNKISELQQCARVYTNQENRTR